MRTEELLFRIIRGQSLARDDAQELMDLLISDSATDIERASFLTGQFFKGSTPEEIIGFSQSLRSHSTAGNIPGLTDIVGTGGDGKNTLNVSTAASIVSSAMGVRIAKHGNTGFTSRHGSADFMKYLGYDFDRAMRNPGEVLQESGFLYVFAPRFNSSFSVFSGIRKRIGHKTVFNIMGPITNPFDPERIVIGTADYDTAVSLAHVIHGRGLKGYVFHSSDGLDEISPAAETYGFSVNGSVREITVRPEEVTGRRIDLSRVTTADPVECFRRTLNGLLGKDDDASVFIALNTAPALVLNNRAQSLRDGYRVAMDAIRSGRVARHISSISEKEVEYSEVS